MKPNRILYYLALFVTLITLAYMAYRLRIDRLSEVPTGLFFDEGANGLDALSILEGNHTVFFPSNQGREGLIMYLVAGAIELWGRTIFAVRLPAALSSALSPIFLMILGVILFQKDKQATHSAWRAWIIAATASGLMVASLSLTIIGRSGLRVNLLPCLMIVAVGGLFAGIAKKQGWLLVVAALCTGLMAYTYIPVRFFPLVLLLLGIHVLWHTRSRATIKPYWKYLALYLGIAFIVALPLLLHFINHPEDFSSRSKSLLVFTQKENIQQALYALAGNTVTHLAAFGLIGDPNWRHNYDQRPLLGIVESILFWLGVLIALRRWQQISYYLLLVWFVVMLLPAILSVDHPPNTFRMVAMMPAVFLLIAVGLWEAVTFTVRSLANLRIFSFSTSKLSCVVSIVAALSLTAYRYTDTYHTYFSVWSTHPEVYQNYNTEWTQLIQTINAIPPKSGIVYILPIGNQFDPNFEVFNFNFLYQGTAPVHLFYANQLNLATQIQEALQRDAKQNLLREVRIVDWTNGVHWSGDSTNRFGLLLGKYGKYEGSEEQINYTVHRFSQINLERTWSLYSLLENRSIRYDGNLQIDGIAIGRHGGDLFHTTDSTVTLDDLPLWIALNWKTTGISKADYKLSLRLHNQQGELVFQHESPILSFDGWPTSRWQANEQSENLELLYLPADMPEGNYELRLVVYDQATLTPTVEIGTWQAEATLVKWFVKK